MTRHPASTARPISHRIKNEAFYRAVVAAGRAPSPDRTQPWRWQIRDGALELLMALEGTSGLPGPADPLATMSCGAALHHALVTLAGQGWRVSAVRCPEETSPTHLARLYIDGAAPVSAEVAAMADAVKLLRTDPRPITGDPVTPASLQTISAAFETASVHFSVLRSDQLLELTVAASDDDNREPATAQSRSAIFAVLHGPGDQAIDWLYAGEALAAGSLTAAALGVSVLPLSPPVGHAALRHAIPELGCLYLALRLGRHASEAIAPPLRRPTRTETVDLLAHVQEAD